MMRSFLTLFFLLLPSASSLWCRGQSADLNGDGRVDMPDLAIMARQWLEKSPNNDDMPLQAIFVRDVFDACRWHLYIPADNRGIYWSRWDFGPWSNRAEALAYFCLHKIMYGIVRPGRHIAPPPVGKTESWQESGKFWGYRTGAWYFRATYTTGDYLDLSVPAGCNRISLIIYAVAAGGGVLGVSWDDGTTTGIDTRQIDTGSFPTGMHEIGLAEHAAPDGVRRLRLTKIDATKLNVRIIGLRCWNTGQVGDPAAIGDDLADGMICLGSDSHTRIVAAGADETVWPITIDGIISTNEFAVKSGPAPDDMKYTGGKHHFTDQDAKYTYHEGEYADGPMLWIDGRKLGAVWDDATLPQGALLTGDSMVIRSRGYADWDGDGWEDEGEPDITWEYIFTAQGVNVNLTYLFRGDTYVDRTCSYCPMLHIGPENAAGGFIRALPGQNWYPLGTTRYFPGASSVELLLADRTILVALHADEPIKEFFKAAVNNKIYGRIQVDALPGGANPQAGDIWHLGGGWSVRRN